MPSSAAKKMRSPASTKAGSARSGAVSLQSVQMNLSRVIGPAVGAPLYASLGVGIVFGLNAATYLFAITALLVAHYQSQATRRDGESATDRLVAGLRIAARDPLIRRVLITVATFSFFSVTFVGLMPEIADVNLGIEPKSISYGLLYAVFGLGAALGAITVGTYLARLASAARIPVAAPVRSRPRSSRRGVDRGGARRVHARSAPLGYGTDPGAIRWGPGCAIRPRGTASAAGCRGRRNTC